MIVGAYAAASNNAPLAAITALFYAVDTLYVVTTTSYSAVITPDELRGRVVSLTRLVALGSPSPGFFLTGLLPQYPGSTRTIVGLTCLLLLLFLATVANKNRTRA